MWGGGRGTRLRLSVDMMRCQQETHYFDSVVGYFCIHTMSDEYDSEIDEFQGVAQWAPDDWEAESEDDSEDDVRTVLFHR